VLLNPVLLVVPALLDLAYQLRLCIMNAACYGAPQSRHVSGSGLREGGQLKWQCGSATCLAGLINRGAMSSSAASHRLH
jgi:hypothetical protein